MRRNRPFTAEESAKLMQLLEKNKSCIESKKSDVETSKIKETAWEKVAIEFNSTNDICRDVKELKTKYKNIRYATKSKMATERRSLYGTGGGPAAVVHYSQQEEACRNMLPMRETCGVENAYDGDAIQDLVEECLQIKPKSKSKSPSPVPELPVNTPAAGPTTLRAPISESLRHKKNQKTSWTKLAEVKSKWTQMKMEYDKEYAKKSLEQLEERHALEMEILRIRLQREKLMLENTLNNNKE